MPRYFELLCHVENRIRIPSSMLLLCTYQKLVNLLHYPNLATDIFAHMNTYGAKMHFIEMARINSFRICLQRCTDIRYGIVTSHVSRTGMCGKSLELVLLRENNSPTHSNFRF